MMAGRAAVSAAPSIFDGVAESPSARTGTTQVTMVDRRSIRSGSLLVALAAASAGCTGLEAGIDYPSNMPSAESQSLTPEGKDSPSISLGEFKFKPELCKGMDTHPITGGLTQEDFTRFLEAQGLKVAPKKARANLYWYDFPNGSEGGFVRLRLALLESPPAAGKDLHDTLLEHGPGWWGVRRSNLAVLAPKTGLGDAAAFAIKLKLPCWGMFTYTGTDDAYVVPGPYMEL